jgi:PAS domain S-box-containing protein
LILAHGPEHRIAAEAVTGDMVVVHLHDEPVTAAAMPETVLHYVLRAEESVILDDAATQSTFVDDPYIREHHARSILCLPLINQGKLIGALYLENNLTPRAFAPARIAVLKLLASQAAISLENTRLYRDLELREGKIRGLVEANIVGICVIEDDYRIVEANDAFLRLLGFDREDLLSGGINWTELTPKGWRGRSAQAFSEFKATGAVKPFEKEYFRKDGSRVPVLVGAAGIGGNERQHVAFVLDLTERKRTEEALRRSEAYLAEAQKLSHTGSWARNPNGETTHSSEEHSRLFGFDPELGVPSFEAFAARIHPEDRAAIIETFGRAIAERKDFETNFRTVLPDGTIKYIRGIGHPVLDGAGKLVEHIGSAVDVTERKRAEQALQEREAKIRRLVDANIIGIFIWDFEGRILEANDAFLRTVGYDREDLASGRLSWTELTPPEWGERDAVLAQHQKMTGILQPFEKEYFRKDGVRVPVLIGTALFEERGDQGVAFVLELTEHKRAEQALRRSEAALAEGQRLTHTGTWIYDPVADRALYWSEEQFRIHGLDPQKDTPDHRVLRRQLHPEDRDRVLARFGEAIRDKLEIEEDFRIVLTDGTAKHLHVVGHPAIDDAGELVEYIGTAVDVTERKQAEKALRESEEKWKAVFENNPTMYFMVDASGVLLSVNPFGAGQLGFTVDELIGLPVQALFHPEDREAVARNTAICFERPGPTMSWEARKIRKNGEVVWVREMARVMLIKDRPVALIVCEDITERKRVSDTLREVQRELAHANRVATMGQLTASIAHEVNQPIAASVTNAHAALRWLGAQQPNLEEARLALGRIVENGNRAGSVISRIRALIKKAPARNDRVSINDAIREVIELTRAEAVKTGVSVRMQLEDGLPLIEGDRVQLQQVILNLVVNAIEAMSVPNEAPRELLLSTGRAEPDGVSVAVRDSGPGLAPIDQERLFEAFYTTKSNGMGMGLSISRSIVEAHGGRLWTSMNEPRGAVFQFTVPVRSVP